MTLRHKIEKINLLLTNQKSTKGYLNNEYFSTSGGLISESTINNQLSASPNNTLGEATTVAASSVSSASSSVNERQQIDDLVDEHQTITSPTIGNVNYELIDMLLIDLKKFIANNVSVWNTRMSEFFKKPKDVSNLISILFSTLTLCLLNAINFCFFRTVKVQLVAQHPLKSPNRNSL